MGIDDDKAAILDVLYAETDAYLRRDFEAMAGHWVHSPQARRMYAYPSLGNVVDEGWDVIKLRMQQTMERNPEPLDTATRMSWERMNIVVGGDMAWASYDQIGTRADDKFEMAGTQHELKIFHRIDGRWKIACIVVMQRAVDNETYPLIEVGPDRKVLWMNAEGHEQINVHPALMISGGRLRARSRSHDDGLQDAVAWGYRQVRVHIPPTTVERVSKVVILGEDDDAAPMFCWVVLEDGKVLVSFDDQHLLERRIGPAQSIYGLSAAQARLAQLIAQGNDLTQAAERLGVSVNTVRTHLQRMFDRTGARSQSALVGILLSAEAPTSR
jgi:DNA-binding CsgD family transcriptional regulator